MITDLQFSRCTDRLLNIRRFGGTALNKPVLLLTLLDIIEVRNLTENLIVLDKEFEAVFRRNWQQFTSQKYLTGTIENPIFHLQNDGFWQAFDKQKKQITGKRAISSLSVGKLDLELFNYCSSPLYRPILRMFLLDSFFPQIEHSYDLPNYITDIENQIREGRQDVIRFVNRIFTGYVRYHKFRKILMEEYEYTCCISHLQTIPDVGIIEAAHIRDHSKTGDSTIPNGLPLCANLHRAFDRGLIGINDKYKVIVNTNNPFKETVSPYSLKQFIGQSILLPQNPVYYPKIENLRWHRKKFGFS